MPVLCEHLVPGKFVNELPFTHYQQAAAHPADCSQIMGNKQIGQIQLALQLLQECENGSLG
ncbi:hypothetical protein D3C81_2337330 [compost metagenome]